MGVILIKKNRRYQDKAQSIAPYPDNAHFCYYQDNAKKMGIILIKKNRRFLIRITPIFFAPYPDNAVIQR